MKVNEVLEQGGADVMTLMFVYDDAAAFRKIEDGSSQVFNFMMKKLGLTLKNQHLLTLRTEKNKITIEVVGMSVRSVNQAKIDRWVKDLTHCLSKLQGRKFSELQLDTRCFVMLDDFPCREIDLANIIINLDTSGRTSLTGINKVIKNCVNLTLVGLGKIKSGTLSLMLVDAKDIQLSHISTLYPWLKIIDKHLKGDKDVLACQEELIDAGYEEHAEL